MAVKRRPGLNRKGKPMTAKQRAAIKKAQIASARKRKGAGKDRRKGLSTGTKVAIAAGVVAVGVGAAYAANHAGNKYAAHVKKKGQQRAKQRANSVKYSSHRTTPGHPAVVRRKKK